MIEPVEKGAHAPRGRVVCDDCGSTDTFPCEYETKGPRKRTAAAGKTYGLNEAQAARKITALGWAIAHKRHRCPECCARRKAANARPTTLVLVHPEPMEPAMTAPPNVLAMSDTRQPNLEQRREIRKMLDLAYDEAAGRYTKGDTDKAVAEALGPAYLPGWVTTIREEFFGPDGGNAEMDALALEMRATLAEARAQLARAERDVTDLTKLVSTVTSQSKRLEAIKVAVGPRAARA